MRIQLLLILLLCSLVVSSSPAAVWDSTIEPIPSTEPVFTLGDQGRPAVADSKSRVHTVFHHHLGDDVFEIGYNIRQEDGTWGMVEIISGTTNALAASIAVDAEDGIHVVWEDIETSQINIQYRYRSPEGVWQGIEKLTQGKRLSSSPDIAVDSFGRVHVAWIDAAVGAPKVFYTRRDSRESAWREREILSLDGNNPEPPTMATDGLGYVHIAWSDRVGDPDALGNYNHEIFYVELGPESDPDIQVLQLTEAFGVSREPFIEATQDGTVHLIWVDNRFFSAFEIFYRRKLPGIGWGKDKRFTYNDEQHAKPVIVAGANQTLNVAWEDFTHGNPEIYYRQITQETGWDPSATRLTQDSSSSVRPFLVADPKGGLLLLWTDTEDNAVRKVFTRRGNALGGP